MRILLVSAHPQFAGTVCAGTLYKHARQGDEVFVVSVSAGDLLSAKIPKKELGRINQKDMEDAASILGFKEVRVLGFQDGEIANTLELRMALNDTIRDLKPQVVLTHWWPNSTMNDCKATGEAVTQACFLALMVTGRWAQNLPRHCTSRAYAFEEPMVAVGFNPTVFVDISDCMEIKLRAISCFKLHCEESFGGDMEAFQTSFTAPNRYWGLKSGVMYAEPFAQIKIHELHSMALKTLPL